MSDLQVTCGMDMTFSTNVHDHSVLVISDYCQNDMWINMNSGTYVQMACNKRHLQIKTIA